MAEAASYLIKQLWFNSMRGYQNENTKGVFGMVGTEAYRFIPAVLPVPDTSVSSVRHQCRYRKLR